MLFIITITSNSTIITIIIIIVVVVVADVFPAAVVSLPRKGRSQATINLVLKFMIFLFLTHVTGKVRCCYVNT